MGIPIARVFGIEIRVTFGWVIVLALVAVVAVTELTAIDPALEGVVGWSLGALVALGFFISSVSHDLAHALVARRRGIEVLSIGVSFFGGATPFDPASGNPGDDAVIAASGPIVSLGIGAALFGIAMGVVALAGEFNAAAGVLIVLVLLNLILGLINLVPAYPLDGGRIVRDLVWRRSGSERNGWRAAARTGRLTGLLIAGAGISYFAFKNDLSGLMVALTGWFFVMSANAVRDRIKLEDIVGGHVVREAMDVDPPTVTPALTVDTFAEQLLDGTSPLFAVPVVDDEVVVGILGPIQLRRLRRTDWATTRVGDAMAKPPKMTTLSPDEPMRPALERMYRAGLDGLPVLEDGKLIGVMTRQGVGRFVAKARQAMPEPARGPRRFGR